MHWPHTVPESTMRVLVTGGAGFIGSHLTEALLRRGDAVTVLDDLSTGTLDNLRAVQAHPRLGIVHGSARDESLVERILENCDAVLHLAAAVGVRLIIERPVHTIETNVGATEVVLRAAARRKRRVLLASTSEVYGKSAKVPFLETDDLHLGPTSHARWAYACSKALDEWLALAYSREHGVPVIIARLFNTVGPRQTGRYGMVLPTLVRQALRGEPLTVYGPGTQTRCFSHVADTVEALIRLLGSDAALGEVVNVGSQDEISIRALAERVVQLTRSTSPIVAIPYEQAYGPGFEDMSRRIPDVSKLARLTGFHCRRSLDAIILDMVGTQSVPRTAHVPVL